MASTIDSTNRLFRRLILWVCGALLLAAVGCIVEPWLRVETPGTIAISPVQRPVSVIIAVMFFFVGACAGSFLNVVVYRLPRGKSLSGFSNCPFCKKPIAPIDNIPIVSWLRLKGRCRTCALPISARYPMVELAAALFVLTLAIAEIALGGANLSIQSDAPFQGFNYNLFDPQWPLLFSMAWHATMGLLLLGMALIIQDGWRIPRRLWWLGIGAILLLVVFSPETLYTLRHRPSELTPARVLRDTALALIAGGSIGLLLSFDRLYRDVSLLLALAGAAFGWPLVIFCGVSTPVLEVICRGLHRSQVAPALMLVSLILFFIITGFPLFYPYLRVMPSWS